MPSFTYIPIVESVMSIKIIYIIESDLLVFLISLFVYSISSSIYTFTNEIREIIYRLKLDNVL